MREKQIRRTSGGESPQRSKLGTAKQAAEKIGELRLLWIFLDHQGGCPISRRVFTGRCGKYTDFVGSPLGDWSEFLPLHRESSEISDISPQKRGEIWGTRIGGRRKL
jgi:hypothetical protein